MNNDSQTLLNLGCGFNKLDGFINVDGFKACNPNVLHNLDNFPWPWADNSIDGILAKHIIEHVSDLWDFTCECARILKPGGSLEITCPDIGSDSALSYRDHKRLVGPYSFHGCSNLGTCGDKINSWFSEQEKVPLELVEYKIRGKKPWWMWPALFRWSLIHLRNYGLEQYFLFRKVMV